MKKISKNVLETIGNTPMIQLQGAVPKNKAKIFAKLEMFNPGGSIKDRICLNMIEMAERKGHLKPGDTVIEPTSGNTGIGLAIVCGVKKYRLILVMPENYSVERRYMMQEMGAEIVLTKASEEMPGAIEKAKNLANEIGGVFLPRQFSNPHNPETHRMKTAPEIMSELPGEQIHAFVAGVGTGGTLTGIGKELKKRNANCLIVAVEPKSSAVLSGHQPAVHKIQGIGAGFIPEILDQDVIDRIETVTDETAYEYTKLLSKKEGILAGISSGAALYASIKLAEELGVDKNIVTIFPDKGERYFSIEKYFRRNP